MFRAASRNFLRNKANPPSLVTDLGISHLDLESPLRSASSPRSSLARSTKSHGAPSEHGVLPFGGTATHHGLRVDLHAQHYQSHTMVKKRVLNPIPVLDEALLSEALRGEGIKEVRYAGLVAYAMDGSGTIILQLLDAVRLLMRRGHGPCTT